MIKRLVALLLAVMMCAALSGCFEEPAPEASSFFDEPEAAAGPSLTESAIQSERGDRDQTWAIYWYLCGSDLETYGGQRALERERLVRARVFHSGGRGYLYVGGVRGNQCILKTPLLETPSHSQVFHQSQP